MTLLNKPPRPAEIIAIGEDYLEQMPDTSLRPAIAAGATFCPANSPLTGFSTEIELKPKLEEAMTGWRECKVRRK